MTRVLLLLIRSRERDWLGRDWLAVAVVYTALGGLSRC